MATVPVMTVSVMAVPVVADVMADWMADMMAEAMADVMMVEVAAGVAVEVAAEMETRPPAPALISIPTVVALVLGTPVMAVMLVPSVAAVMVLLASGCHLAYRPPTELGEAKFLLNQGHRTRCHLWESPGPASRNTTISPSNFASTSSPLT